MLLGIVLHAALSFVDFPWVVQDRSSEPALGLLVLAVHGFRMPVFFLLSGFFAAMRWRRYGLAGLLRHRAKRIALPLLLACLTILPVTWLAMGWAKSREGAGTGATVSDTARDIWTAAAFGDLEALRAHVEAGASLDAAEPLYGHSPLGWAALAGQEEAVRVLLDAGADPAARYLDDNTALHSAAFLGRAKVAALLLEAGADAGARNTHGETPLDSLRHDRATTESIAGLLKVPVDFARVTEGRARIREMLVSRKAPSGVTGSPTDSGPSEAVSQERAWLVGFPFFQHLWFLWFLCWLLAGFALVAWTTGDVPRLGVPSVLVSSPLCLLWLVPLTLLTQWRMHGGGTLPGFGADDSAGLLPMPHVLAHYAIFFGFGAVLYGRPGAIDRLGRGWWLHLSLAVSLLFPTLGLSLHAPDMREAVTSEGTRHLLASLGEVLYAWLMVFGLLGLFGRLLGRERAAVRYVSDSSYWLYLAHLPLIVVGQVLLSGVELPALVKFTLLVAGTTVILLLSYQWLVRYTWVGRLLNGPRSRGPAQGVSQKAGSWGEGSAAASAAATANRTDSGVSPVQPRNARKKELGSSKPSRKPISA
jgi:hypothetical protein